MKKIDDFYLKAKQFCSLLEKMQIFELHQCKVLIAELMEIYKMALVLPDVDPETSDLPEVRIDRIGISFGKYDSYWEIYNPYECDSAVSGSLSDDFSDIYNELKTGVLLYEEENVKEAVWQWKWSFDNHCCYHIVDALRALNQLMFD